MSEKVEKIESPIFDNIIEQMQSKYPVLKGAQFIGEMCGNDTISMTIFSELGVIFVDVNYKDNPDGTAEILKIVEASSGKELPKT